MRTDLPCCDSNIIKPNTLPASALLSACSVGRYSLHFWTPISEGGLGNDGIISVPPDWVYADLKAAAVSYWFAWNPWALLASTAISSAVSTF